MPWQTDEDYQKLDAQCKELEKLQETIFENIRKTYIAAKKFEVALGSKKEVELRQKAIENGIREAEFAMHRFEELRQNK